MLVAVLARLASRRSPGRRRTPRSAAGTRGSGRGCRPRRAARRCPRSTTFAPSRSSFAAAAATASGSKPVLGAALLVLGPHVGARRAGAGRTRSSARASSRRSSRPRCPRRSASSSSSWHMNVVTHATFALTASPIGTPSVAERRVVVVDPVAALPRGRRTRTRARRCPSARRGGSCRGGCTRPTPAGAASARLRHDVARRHRDVLAGVAGERRLGHAPQRDPQPFLPHLALLDRVDQEPAELGLRRRLAGAEVGAAVRHEVEHRDALGDAGRVVERRRRLHDAVPEPDALRALRRGGEEHLGRARVRVLLEEVVLDLPHVVDAERVGELDLLERVLDQLVLGVRRPTAAAAGARRRCRTSRRAPRRVGRRRARGTPRGARRGRAVARERVLELGGRGCAKFCPVRRRATRPSPRVPQRADHLGARDSPPGLADERAVAHLGERGAQVLDVRRLVGRM